MMIDTNKLCLRSEWSRLLRVTDTLLYYHIRVRDFIPPEPVATLKKTQIYDSTALRAAWKAQMGGLMR